MLCPCVCPVYMSRKGTWAFPASGKEIWEFFYLYDCHKVFTLDITQYIKSITHVSKTVSKPAFSIEYFYWGEDG